MISEEGREVTLYRLLERISVFSASIAKNIQFDITIEAEKDSNICIIPAVIYKRPTIENWLLSPIIQMRSRNGFSEEGPG